MSAFLSKIFGVNYTTNIPAILTLVCGAVDQAGLMPASWEPYALKVCAALLAVGLINSKSSNVSNSPTPTVSQLVK